MTTTIMLESQSVSVLENVTNAAVWGSLAASFFLGAFFLVQSFVDRAHRARFIAFAVINFLVALTDFCHRYLSFYDYERIRIVLWSVYPGILLWVLKFPIRFGVLASVTLFSAAVAAWELLKPELGTSMVVGPTAYIAAIAHGLDFKQRRCYASCVLCGCSLALGMLSTFYYAFIASGDGLLIATGYAHYAGLNLLALLFGWVHFPRELSGRAPVRVSTRAAALYIGTMGMAQAGVLISLLVFQPWQLSGYLSGALALLGATLLLFFHHRHQLVIYTENVTVLLDQRTASLKSAQEALASQNERQAELLAAQAKEIYEKNEVIERQRRLELAAQTAGQAAHDIRNILWPIELQLNLLQRHMNASAGLGPLQNIKRQLLRLRELTDQHLALSRRGQLQFHPILLNDLLRDASLDTAGVPIRIEWEGEAWVSASASQLLRAVVNLVTNAIDATNNRPGSVTLSCGGVTLEKQRRCHMGYLEPGRYNFVRVSDNGPGIPMEVMDRIFEPFFSTKPANSVSGSGLGLSIVAAVVSDHGGVLDIETSSKGTTFSIYLPFHEAPLSQRRMPRPHSASQILVLDDDPVVRRMCEQVLRDNGFLVATASSLQECRRYLAKSIPDLLLLDLHLPDGSGHEVLQDPNVSGRLRVLVFSSFLTSDECRRLAELGATRFAYKPLGSSSLLSAIEEALFELPPVLQSSREVMNA